VETLELYSSLRPQAHEEDLAKEDMESTRQQDPATERVLGYLGLTGNTVNRIQTLGRNYNHPVVVQDEIEEKLGITAGVKSVATAGKVGELFQYAIATPVTLSRHESAMLPIINDDVKAEKVSIYNIAVRSKHPLAGVRLTNATKLHLMQGPITVFDGGAYAGDAKIDDIPPGSQRLLSYALDLDTEVAPGAVEKPEELLSVRIVKGTLIATRKQSVTLVYTIKNSGDKAKTVLVEQPIFPGCTLVAPKIPTEETRDCYRFAVEAKPGVPAKLTVEQQHVEPEQLVLSNLDDGTILFYVRAKQVGAKVKEALLEVIKRKQAIQEVAVRRAEFEQQIRTIAEEQGRIRENMGRLDHGVDLYKRYVKKFSDQEDEIEKLRSQIKSLTDQETELRKALDAYLTGLELS
jgi:hypothetical protein